MNIDNIEMLANYSDVLTFQEFKEIIRLGRNTCYDILNNGTVKSIKVGREFRIPKVNVIKFLLNEPQ